MKNYKQEILAGVTTFIASVYIIITNALILSDAGMSQNSAMIATILTSGISTILMGLISDSPLVLVPGMGINSLFTYTIVNSMNLSYQEALGAVFVSGIIFTLIASTKFINVLLTSIPTNLKHAITVGVGFMIFFIGLQKSGLVVSNEATLISMGDLSNKEVILSIITLFLIIILSLKNINASLLISIFVGTILSFLLKINSLENISLEFVNFNDFKEVFLAMKFDNIFSFSFLVSVFSITIVIIFENMGLIYGQLDAMNNLDKFDKSFKVCGISNLLAGIFGTSPTITAAENFSGISVGAKSKVASLTAGILFLLSIFLIPILKLIPNAVISAVLIYIGILMIQTFFDLKSSNKIEIISMIFIITLIPFTYNIVNGISVGFIVYTVLNLLTNSKQKVSKAMIFLSVLFLINFLLSIILGINH